eukprot:10563306-Alexandrium_andersonii.AAC.1
MDALETWRRLDLVVDSEVALSPCAPARSLRRCPMRGQERLHQRAGAPKAGTLRCSLCLVAS